MASFNFVAINIDKKILKALAMDLLTLRPLKHIIPLIPDHSFFVITQNTAGIRKIIIVILLFTVFNLVI